MGDWNMKLPIGLLAALSFPGLPKEPCGECHLQPGEVCDICGATEGESK